MADPQPLLIVAGAGAGLGRALLQRFQAGGFKVVGLVRSQPEPLPGAELHRIDLTDGPAATAKLRAVMAEHGAPKVVIHNTAELVIKPFLETDPADFERCWRSMVQTLANLAQATLPEMIQASGGALLVSGATASLRGGARFAAFASAKFALRGLTQSLAREHQSAGIHVAHIVLDGIIDNARSRDLHSLNPDRMMKTEDIAEVYWQLARQPPSTWSHEIDLRPATESF
ncbi:MAG: SDR family NAD(P)-dependent oxidoreductase [Rhodospirillales bacterium]